MIFKVQQSVFTNAPKPQMFIYDESRKYEYQADLTEDVRKMLGEKPKAYFRGELIPNEGDPETFQVGLYEEVEEQDW